MAILNDMHSIIVSAGSANFSAHSYTEVYAGATVAPTINGVSVSMAAGSSIRIKVKSISSTAGIYLLGETIDNLNENPRLGG